MFIDNSILFITFLIHLQYSTYIMEKNGLVSGKAYPYVKKEQTCSANGVRFGRNSILLQARNINPKLFKALLAKGPVATRILITDKFKNYKGGDI